MGKIYLNFATISWIRSRIYIKTQQFDNVMVYLGNFNSGTGNVFDKDSECCTGFFSVGGFSWFLSLMCFSGSTRLAGALLGFSAYPLTHPPLDKYSLTQSKRTKRC